MTDELNVLIRDNINLSIKQKYELYREIFRSEQIIADEAVKAVRDRQSHAQG